MNKKKSGFTLIEIIVVLIIVGILAAIALPNIFYWIPRSQALGQIYPNYATYRNNLQACLLAHPTDDGVCSQVALIPTTYYNGWSISGAGIGAFGQGYPSWHYEVCGVTINDCLFITSDVNGVINCQSQCFTSNCLLTNACP